MEKLGIVLLLVMSKYSEAQDCVRANSEGADSLPSFSDPENAPQIRSAPIQAIIKSYKFHCCGIVAGWAAYIEPGSAAYDGQYTIKFQIWRPLGDNQYEKIGENMFPFIRFESPSEINVETPSNEWLQFQLGDVIGYYLEEPRNSQSRGGLQFDRNFNREELWYTTGDPSLQDECRLGIGAQGELSLSTSLGPIISVSFTTTDNTCPSTFTSTMFCPTPTSSTPILTTSIAMSTPAAVTSQTSTYLFSLSSLTEALPSTSVDTTKQSPVPTIPPFVIIAPTLVLLLIAILTVLVITTCVIVKKRRMNQDKPARGVTSRTFRAPRRPVIMTNQTCGQQTGANSINSPHEIVSINTYNVIPPHVHARGNVEKDNPEEVLSINGAYETFHNTEEVLSINGAYEALEKAGEVLSLNQAYETFAELGLAKEQHTYNSIYSLAPVSEYSEIDAIRSPGYYVNDEMEGPAVLQRNEAYGVSELLKA